MSPTLSSAFTGCVFLSASGQKSPSWSTRPPRLCSVVPWPVYLRCRPTKSPRVSLLLQRLPRSASGSQFHYWQPSIFGCWPSGQVWTACHRRLRRHRLWRPSVLDSRRSCLRNHILTFDWSDILFLHIVYSGPNSVFKHLGHSKTHDWLIDSLLHFNLTFRDMLESQ